MLSVKNLSVSFAAGNAVLQAVKDISFDIKKGETMCLIGESGSGKSLSALAVLGLLPHATQWSAGEMSFDGMNLAALSEAEWAEIRGNRMSMVFQEPMTALNPTMTIGDQLTEVYVRHRRATREQARRRALDLLERVGITSPVERFSQYPHQQSGGIRQRIVIAMALMCEPDVIIADEPTTALDVTIQAQILRLMKDLVTENDTAMLFITHDLGVVAHIADQVAVMYAGGFVEVGDVRQVLQSPAHPYTRALLECLPDNLGLEAGALGTIPGTIKPAYAGDRGCRFAERCADVLPRCHQDEPPVHRVEREFGIHTHSCWLAAVQ